ncbi:glucoamylase family protein [Altererythrobacter sp. ZODW24]|uniref:GH36-type glycosyl hydrolase domain-containing protein n=1 Tax=Altererythrobacter sp. ZODW24 TaxID=2185142 RepID=UPI001F076795|nr:glucoamylase family protein [Altererythrobacter sp. ZODW24]
MGAVHDTGFKPVLAARELAAQHIVALQTPDPIPVWDSVPAMRRWLDKARVACTDPPPNASKAAEWLLDNDYQIHRALRQIEQDLPQQFYRQLPALGEQDEGYPRVFALAHALLRSSHLQLTLATATDFIREYQSGAALTIAELWAFPTMLRIACVELLAASLTPLLDGAFDLPVHLSRFAADPQSLDATECTARSIANLGIISTIPWKDFFDRISLVEEELGNDPSGHYAVMDFDTRDRYRAAVEEIAEASHLSELKVASAAVRRAQTTGAEDVRHHVGYWLADKGRRELERDLGAAPSIKKRAARFIYDHPGKFYAATILFAGIGSLILPALYLTFVSASLGGWLAAMIACLLPASVLAITAVHWAITRLVPPSVLPKLDFTEGLPGDAPTAVVVPIIIGNTRDIQSLAEQLETHWLANVDPNLQIALLADLPDAPQELMPGDAALEQALTRAVETLNRRHVGGAHKPFHLFLRPRQYNPSEGCWMAWERKRGKLEQLNRLLVDGDGSGFSQYPDAKAAFRKTRYVVTVDADTLLPPGSVAKLVGTLAHPLNRARIDPDTGRIARGYALVQPRVEISPRAGIRTLFARLFTGETAIDIYSRAVSDVYQDLFGAGIFVGKGIYDVRAFHASVEGRIPDNRILSHDLFEGAHGRAALATDIVLYEDFPATYPEYARRLHRWIRGDWQLLPWLWHRVPGRDETRLRNHIAGIDRWKMLDNLRRSLIAPGLVVMALAGWFFLPGSPWFWTALVLLAPAGQLFTDLVSGLARGRRVGASYGLVARLSDQTGRWLLAMVTLLHEAILSVRAISVTQWRNFVSHRHLLEWTAAAQVAARMKDRSPRAMIWRDMGLSSALAIVIVFAIAVLRPAALAGATILLLPWIAAPEIMLWTGRPRRSATIPLLEGDAKYLRLLARRTWYYFESFAGPEDNWLPPDNYQGPPHEEIGHRTSPTNIGMLLMSTASAWDLGFLGRAEMLARGRTVFDALGKLDKYRGHFYNWYETLHLRPLEPRYVSTVDSGNLAVGLIAFAETLREAAGDTALEPQRWDGVQDLLRLMDQAGKELDDSGEFRRSIATMQAQVDQLKRQPQAQNSGLKSIEQNAFPALEELAERLTESAGDAAADQIGDLIAWLERLSHHIHEMRRDIGGLLNQEEALYLLADEAVGLAWAMDFAWLYDEEQRLFFIGYNVTTSQIDTHHYDLLASEARLASFFAIAKGDVPLEHWFHLERPVTRAAGGLSLVSWNGSMFEYLMPRLLLRSEPETLLGESERVAVEIQRRHGLEFGRPWGVSESAYSDRDPEQRYRYQAFGTPGLGLRRGLARYQVIAPYASALALAVAPGHATANLRALSALGAEQRYGMWEAVDYTPGRENNGTTFTPVIAYMAHHQGMTLCAIANALTDDRLVERFARDPQVRLVSLLLSERIPHELPPEISRLETLEAAPSAVQFAAIPPWKPVETPFPQVNLMGNGRLASWISAAGGGGLSWHGRALTRFVPDAARDADGIWIYLNDIESGALWSATRQPTGEPADEYNVLFQPHLTEFHRRGHGIDVRMEVGVGSGDDLEIRRVTLLNESDRPRKLRMTSYAEVVLAPSLEDERHPAFSKLFVSGEFVRRASGVLFRRRPRGYGDAPPTMLHYLIDEDGPLTQVRHEIDRRAFIGRNRSLRDPAGASQDLTGSEGFTLDPVAALQTDIDLEPGERRVFCFVTIASSTRESALEVAARHASLGAMEWVLGDAAAEESRAVGHARCEASDLPALQSLGSVLVHPHGALRCAPHRISENFLGQGALWGLALSGDLPILLLRASGAEQSLISQLVGAHQLWRRHGLQVDLVILQTNGSTYSEPMRGELTDLLNDIKASDMLGRNGGIHLLFADQIGGDQVRLLDGMAWAILEDNGTSLQSQLASASQFLKTQPPILPTLAEEPEIAAPATSRAGLIFENGIGGFTEDGRDYVINLAPGETTPAPWVNILANDRFGTLVTEAGGGFTWATNSGEYRLTGWTNDPVIDRATETLYLRDEETAAVWTVTPSPCGQDTACEVRHSAGYSQWRQSSHGLEQEQRVWVAADAPVKLIRLRLTNTSTLSRRLTATYFAEWLLGALPSIARRHVVCEFNDKAKTIFARNPWNADFSDRVVFLTASADPHGFTTDREEFLGRERDPARPAALDRWGLSGSQVAGRDTCAAYQVHIDLAPGETEEVVFVLGEGADKAEAVALAEQWRTGSTTADPDKAIIQKWDEILSRVNVETPDPAFDIMVNRWLIYQSVSSRILARTGFYQASGAFGFRDQLQDMLALLAFDPARVREHILECAAHQFEEGDVLHWWHPPEGRGVRTRCSDDLLWLPYATGSYVAATGDTSILHEVIPFLSAPELRDEEGDRYAQFEQRMPGAPLIDHCERALERVAYGSNGLPLIGAGDWNDGMDRIGREGRGESVWLAWFYSVTARMMADMDRRVGRIREADHWSERADMLMRNAEEAGWDGEWYRRAYDDAGHPLGSASEEECRIDSISQSWAAFAGANPKRVEQALTSAEDELIDRDAGLARLLWPPFDTGPRDPGYIKAYPPGIRENGGQYSHAAAWLGLALAQTGKSDAALEIFHMLSAVRRVDTPEAAEKYRTEPYAITADIGGAAPHRGKGGWSWYTGAAAWTWRLSVEGLLGLTLRDGALHIAPSIPADWPGFRATFRQGEATIAVSAERSNDAKGIALIVDGKPHDGVTVPFPSDGETRDVKVLLGKATPSETGDNA